MGALRRSLTNAWVVAVGWAVTAAAQGPPGSPLLVLDPGGHTAVVAKLAFTPDGRRLVSVSHDKTIRIWDLETGESPRVLRPPIGPGRQGMLYALAIAPDGNTLAVGGLVVHEGRQSWIYLISLESGAIENVLVGHTSAIFDLAFSPDGRHLASGGGDDLTARLWDVGTGQCRFVLKGHRQVIADVAFSPDGRRLATASRDRTARIWSVETGQTERILPGHRADVAAAAFSPDGSLLATGSADGSIRLWTLQGTVRSSFGNLGGKVGALKFTPDGRRLLFALQSDRAQTGVYLRELATGRTVWKATGYDAPVYDVALSPDGSLAAAAGGSANEISLWRAADGLPLRRMGGGGRAVVSCGWGPDGRTIAWGNTLRPVAHNNFGPLERAFHLLELQPADPPDQTFRRAVDTEGFVRLRKTGEYEIRAERRAEAPVVMQIGRRERVLCSTLLGSGRAAVGTTYSLFLFDTANGRRLGEFRGHSGYVSAVAPSADGRWLLSASADQTLRIWSPKRTRPLVSLFVAGNEWIAWTPEGYYAASPGGERLMGWQINRGLHSMAAFHPAIRFRKSLYRPDVIRLLLHAGGTSEALALADQQSGHTSRPWNVADVLPPTVQITKPAGAKAAVDAAKVEVEAVATPRGDDPVVAMRLLLDGRPYGGSLGRKGIVRDRPEQKTARQTWTVELTPGVHRLAVTAETATAYGMSDPVEVSYAAERASLPDLYVLAVGLSEHKEQQRNLNFGAIDAKALAEVFQQVSPALFGKVEVKLLSDSEATGKGILEGLDWLSERMTQRDVAAFFYSGHGVRDRHGEFFLFPFDGDSSDIAGSGVPEPKIKERLQSTPGRLLLLLDACHAGAIGGDFGRPAAMVTDDLVRDLLSDDYGVIVMCSSMGREVSLENPDWGHGAFTKALLEGLRGRADYNRDTRIHLNELDLYVSDRVDKLTDGRQHPVTQKPTTIRSFPLAKP